MKIIKIKNIENQRKELALGCSDLQISASDFKKNVLVELAVYLSVHNNMQYAGKRTQ